jgi:hypothetical protein
LPIANPQSDRLWAEGTLRAYQVKVKKPSGRAEFVVISMPAAGVLVVRGRGLGGGVEANPGPVGQVGDPLGRQHGREGAKHAWQPPGRHDGHAVGDRWPRPYHGSAAKRRANPRLRR